MNEEIYKLLGINPESAREKAFTQGLLGSIFQAAALSGPQPRPVSTAQALGQVGLAGMGAYESSFDKTLKEALTGIQLKDLVRRQTEQERVNQARERYTQRMQELSGGVVTPSMALAGGQGPTPAAAATLGQPIRDMAGQQQFAAMELLGQVAPEELAKLAFKEPKAEPTSIQEYRFAVNQGFQGTFEDFKKGVAKAGATSIVMPGDKKLAEALGTGAAKRLDDSLTSAQEAQSTLQNISELRPILEQGVFSGPLSAAPRAVAQIASQLGVTGKDTTELLQRTAVAMQGLAKFELSAAAAMRGQGAITENERMLIQRAAGGRLDQFTASEVQSLLTAMEKTANYRIQSHNRQLEALKKTAGPEISELLPLYELRGIPAPSAPTGIKRFNPATGRVE